MATAFTLLACFAAAGFLSAADRGRVAQSTDQPAAATTETPAEGASKSSPAGTPATVLDDQQVTAILGKSVRGKDNEDMGRIVDIIVNQSGQVRAAVIDFGGFLGVGSRKIAIDWSALHFTPAGRPDRITLDLTRNQVRLAPEYKSGEPVVVVGTGSETPQPMTGNPASEK
jgi:hypothetical protein